MKVILEYVCRIVFLLGCFVESGKAEGEPGGTTAYASVKKDWQIRSN